MNVLKKGISIADLSSSDMEKKVNKIIEELNEQHQYVTAGPSFRTLVVSYRFWIWAYFFSMLLSLLMISGSMIYHFSTYSTPETYLTTMEGELMKIQPYRID